MTQEAKELKQEFISRYLIQVLAVPPESAQQDAAAMMQHLSLETIERMVAFFEYVHNCPMINQNFLKSFVQCCAQKSIPHEPHQIPMCPWATQHVKTLMDLKAGEKGRIMRLTAQGAIRRRLIDMGVLPDVLVELQSIAPLGDPLKIKIKGYYLTLRKNEAEGILLKDDEPQPTAV